MNETSPNDLVSWIVVGALAETTIASRATSAGPLLSVENLVVPQESWSGLVGPVSLEIYPGETLALVGLRGAGHHAIGRAIFGALPVYSGRIFFQGRELKITDPDQMGAPFFVEPIFDGTMLILAVGLAVTAAKRGTKRGRTTRGVPGAASTVPAIRVNDGGAMGLDGRLIRGRIFGSLLLVDVERSS